MQVQRGDAAPNRKTSAFQEVQAQNLLAKKCKC